MGVLKISINLWITPKNCIHMQNICPHLNNILSKRVQHPQNQKEIYKVENIELQFPTSIATCQCRFLKQNKLHNFKSKDHTKDNVN